MKQRQIASPSSWGELLHYFQEAEPQTKILAGGTDFSVSLRGSTSVTMQFIDITHVKELCFIREEGEYLYIGATTTFTKLEQHPLMRQYGGCLYQAAGRIGSKQIRNMATIGGNIANGAPAADSVVALLALRAEASAYNHNLEHRWIPLSDLLKNFPTDCLLTAIRFPKLHSNACSGFAKVGTRSSVTISQLILSCVFQIGSQNNRIEKAAVALGAVGPHAFLDEETSERLIGELWDQAIVNTLTTCLQETIASAIPGRASLSYKRIAICGLVEDVLSM